MRCAVSRNAEQRGIHRFIVPNSAHDVPQVIGDRVEDIVEREYADQLTARADNGNTPHGRFAHPGQRLFDLIRGMRQDRIRRHHVCHSQCRRIDSARNDRDSNVTTCEHAHRFEYRFWGSLLHDDQIADVLVFHEFRGLIQFIGRPHRNGVSLADLTDIHSDADWHFPGLSALR